jgi:hypothetical protein
MKEPSPETIIAGVSGLPQFHCEIAVAMNGFLMLVNGRTFVIQTGSHSEEAFDDVIEAVRISYIESVRISYRSNES